MVVAIAPWSVILFFSFAFTVLIIYQEHSSSTRYKGAFGATG